MTRKDMELMAEAYEQIEEGIFSRAKARVAGVAGSAKDAIQRGRGQVQKVAGRVAAAAGAKKVGGEIRDAGQAKVNAGQGSGAAAKQASITASLIKGVIDDLTKLGLAGNPQVVEGIQTALQEVFTKLLEPPFADADADAEVDAPPTTVAPAAAGADAPPTAAYRWAADDYVPY